MNTTPLISVIVTCHNQEEVIAKTLGSVLDQSYSNWECLIVNDGSGDKSAEEINKFVRKDGRVKYFYQDNKGVASARNLAFDNASGEYIQFLDGDDLLHPEKLESHITHFSDNITIDISCANHRHYYPARDHYDTYEFKKIEPYPLKQLLSEWHKGVSLPIHASIFKRSIWNKDELPFPEDYYERCEDWVFLVLVAAKNKRFSFLDKVLCTYVMHDENFTRSIKKSCIAAIHAAYYLENKIPLEFQKNFVSGVIARSLERYLVAKKPELLRNSKNWQLGNSITRPFFDLVKIVNKNIGGR